MPTIINCTKCSTRMKVQDAKLGKQIRCPNCQTIVTAPLPELGLVEDLPFVEPVDEITEAPRRPANNKYQWVEQSEDGGKEERARKANIKPPMPSSIMICIIALLVILCVQIGFGLMGFTDKNTTEMQVMAKVIQLFFSSRCSSSP